MSKIIKLIINTNIIQIPLTLLSFLFYSVIIGISLSPSIILILFGIKTFLININFNNYYSFLNIIYFAITCASGIYLYFIFGSFFLGMAIRIISLGIKEGVYSTTSLTFIRWLLYSGIFMVAVKTILSFIPMTYFSVVFFKLLGCKMGKNVFINTPNLDDCQFIEFGDNVVVGGMTNISCHTFENNKLVLGKIKIGSNVLIGTFCYIMPNVTIGNNCNIGMYSYIRKNTNIPDKSYISAISGMPVKRVIKIERGDL